MKFDFRRKVSYAADWGIAGVLSDPSRHQLRIQMPNCAPRHWGHSWEFQPCSTHSHRYQLLYISFIAVVELVGNVIFCTAKTCCFSLGSKVLCGSEATVIQQYMKKQMRGFQMLENYWQLQNATSQLVYAFANLPCNLSSCSAKEYPNGKILPVEVQNTLVKQFAVSFFSIPAGFLATSAAEFRVNYMK